jgi:rhodanese-related sulfurtransferase
MRKFTTILTILAAAMLFTPLHSAPQEANQPQGAKQKAPPSKAKVLTRAEIDGLLATPEKVLFIDVRRPDEVSSNGGFPVYLSIQSGELEKHLAEIPKDRPIVTVSNHAARAGRAADLLDSKGFKVIGAAGVEDYEAQGGKIIKIEVPKQTSANKQ